MPFVEDMVEAGVVERPDATDAIWRACVELGFVAEKGEDAVQAIIADCTRRKTEDAPADGQINDAEASRRANGQAHPRKSTKKPTQADVLIEIATGADVELFHAPDGKAFADIPVDGHRETWSLKNSGFKHWLKREFYQRTAGAPNSEAMSMAMGVIEARAHYDGAEHEVYLRVANCGDQIYLDLCDPAWRVVEITSDGWRIIARCREAHFGRTHSPVSCAERPTTSYPMRATSN